LPSAVSMRIFLKCFSPGKISESCPSVCAIYASKGMNENNETETKQINIYNMFFFINILIFVFFGIYDLNNSLPRYSSSMLFLKLVTNTKNEILKSKQIRNMKS